jgi:hypothetical protein
MFISRSSHCTEHGLHPVKPNNSNNNNNLITVQTFRPVEDEPCIDCDITSDSVLVS